ncbi:hydrogenase maturation nickel metallochaperone HypA, partial [Chloroflexota bacterium]
MHELSVAQSILKIALDNAEKAQAKKIISINLVIGQLASIVDDSINFYWDIISDETIAKGAKLVIQRIPVGMRCYDCGKDYSPGEDSFDCPDCSSIR